MNSILRSVTLILVLFSTMTANSFAASDSPVLTRIQTTSKLVLGTSGNMPMMSEKTETGEVIGYDIDMARALAASMDVELVTKVMPFDKLIPALQSGEVDIVLSNMTMTVDRNMHVAFAGPYFLSGKCMITKEENLAKTDKAEELSTADITVAVIEHSTSEHFVRELLPQLRRIAVADASSGVEMVTKGKAKAMLSDFPICLSVMKRYPDRGFQSIASLLTYEPIGIALPANDPLFINLTRNFLTRIENTGVTDALMTKWFGDAVIRPATEK